MEYVEYVYFTKLKSNFDLSGCNVRGVTNCDYFDFNIMYENSTGILSLQILIKAKEV